MFELSGMKVSSSSTTRSGSSSVATRGAISRLFDGRKLSRYLMSSMQLSSSSAAKWATPDFELWLIAPPSSSNSTSSPVTVLITSGPVMNMCEVFLTMKMKSVIAGE